MPLLAKVLKMYVKLIFLCFSLFCCEPSTGCAESNYVSSKVNQYRIGLSLTGEYALVDLSLHNRTSKALREEGTYSGNGHHSCRKLQLSPGIEFGSKIINKYYIGLVFNYHYTRVSTQIKNSMPYFYFMEHEFKLKSSADALLKFGYTPMPKVMFYGVAGPTIASWEHNTRTFLLKSDDTLDMKNYSASKNKTVGFAFGAGVEFLVRDKYAIDCVYTLAFHRPRSINYQTYYTGVNPAVPITSDRDLNVQKSVRLSYSTIGLRFSYFFSL